MQTTSKRRSVLLYNPVFIEYGNTTTEFCSLRIYNKICCARASHLIKHTVSSHHSSKGYRDVPLDLPECALQKKKYGK